MFSKIHEYLAQVFPALGRPKRFLLALLAQHSKTQETYSQNGEDRIAIEILLEKGLNRQIFYVDVGANHPSKLSNTYLMYRQGSHGITIEPNEELIKLHRLVRPKDIQLNVGCGFLTEIQNFYYSKTPVLSSFAKSEVDHVWMSRRLPIFTLDKICQDLNIACIDFLTIDVEGLDLQVLQGSESALKITYLVCIEANTIEAESQIIEFMSKNNFEFFKKNKWNLFFINRKINSNYPANKLVNCDG